ncbi:c-type cytochrome [Muriicola sp. Z0-33]|uniref:DUF7133 domain-containing protein n=1 Tax=Muriicola sp. Z0-33 TaxID=2816957 RepID=UPI002238492D|nr:c-type cytochrome [Muriicola sp. Z0-33]
MFTAIALLFIGCNEQPSPPLSPEEALASFVLAEEDLEIQLVASEPMVQDPVAITFDEAGRLWVVEMLGFMADIDGTGELDPVGRVSVLFDDDMDGKMDRSTVFLDSLVLPRAVAIVKGGVLISENIPLWYAEDTDGDFVADKKVLIDSTYGGSGMPEHSANGLWRGMDNWLYNAKSSYRYKEIDGKWKKDSTEFRGQWGIVHDNAGRLFYNYNWSQLHADLVPPNALLANKNHTPSSGIDHGLTLEREIYPIRSNTAVNRGYVPGTLDAKGRLLEFASACGPLIYRGDALPQSYDGDAFICEPTANLIKRNKISSDGFMLAAEGRYKNREFLASTDERFRPISAASGPDGAIYVVDMYKGIIQHGPYMTPYLRKITLDRKLDQPIHMGRIWRITSKKENKQQPANLSGADTKTLVHLLEHPNGWTRDMAQRLLVDKADTLSIPELNEMVTSGSELGKLHALWTLEGLGAVDAELCLKAMKANDPFVAQTAVRILMQMKNQDVDVIAQFEEFIQEEFNKAHPVLQMQMVMASNTVSAEVAFEVAERFLDIYKDLPLSRDVVMSSLADRELQMLGAILSHEGWEDREQYKEIFLEMLATAITNGGSVEGAKAMFTLLESNSGQSELWIATAIAQGIANAKRPENTPSIELEAEPDIFKGHEHLPAEIVLLFKDMQRHYSWPGKTDSTLPDSEISNKINREVYALGRQQYLNLCANCHATNGEGMKRFAPPLKNSSWVTGDQYKLAMILLHGMEGPVTVDGKLYDIPDILPSMPSFTTLQNNDIAAIATYIRNSWGNSAPEIGAGTIGRIRFRTQGKITPWKATELDTVIFDEKL